jgi:hypothetical protein
MSGFPSDEALSRLLHRFRYVIDVSSPVMDQVRESLSESGTIMILTDPSGVILKADGDPSTLEAAEDVRLVSGVSFQEHPLLENRQLRAEHDSSPGPPARPIGVHAAVRAGQIPVGVRISNVVEKFPSFAPRCSFVETKRSLSPANAATSGAAR